MKKYDIIFNELQIKVESGELTLEQAEELNDIAYEKYANDDTEYEEVTEFYDDEGMTYEEYLESMEEELFGESYTLEGVHWDTLLTRPEIYFNKSFKIYHYANIKKDIITPITVNAGNKLAKPRFSSWWTPFKQSAGWALMCVLFSKFKENKWKEITWGQEAFKDSRVQDKITVGIIGESFFEKNKDFITSIEVYEHEKTFKGKDLGRGNEYSVDEFTCDFPVKPDNIRKVTWDEIKNYIKIVPDEDLPKYEKAINNIRVNGKHLQDMVHEKKPWLYWEFETTEEIRQKYCNEHGIDFKIDEEYFRYTYYGEGIYEALRKHITNDEWKSFLKSSACTWLPKPDKYPTTCISYFTKQGRDMFIKKALPSFKKYLGDDIEFSKIKNPKNIVYKDKYQVFIVTKIS